MKRCKDLGIANFLQRSLFFPILLFSSIFLHWLLRKALLSFLAILWNSAFKWVYLSFSPLPFTSLLSQLFARPPQTTILPFCISFSWRLSWFLSPVQCHKPPSTVHQALLSIRSSPLNLFGDTEKQQISSSPGSFPTWESFALLRNRRIKYHWGSEWNWPRWLPVLPSPTSSTLFLPLWTLVLCSSSAIFSSV